MTNASRPRKFQWRYAGVWPLVALVIGGLSIWRFIDALRGGRVDGLILAVGILGTLLVLTVLLAIPAVRSQRRVAYLRRQTPEAFVCTAAVYPEAVQQFHESAEVSGGTTRHLWGNTWAELWCDGHEVRLYGGTTFGFGGRPKVLARIPLPEGWTASVERAQQGPYMMNTLRISGTYPNGDVAVNILPNWFAGVLLLPYYKSARMEPFASQLRALAKNPLRGNL